MAKRRLVEIVWLDPVKNEMKIDDLKKILDSGIPLKKLLVKSHSYGVIMTGDEEVILLKGHENEIGDREFKTIPRALIQKIIPYDPWGKGYKNIDYYLATFS